MSDSPQTVRLMDQIKVGASLFGWLTIVFIFLMVVIATGGTIYSRIYEQGRAAGTQDLMLIMERMQKLQQPMPVQHQVQTAPSMTVVPSPYESVCRNHNGIRSVTPVHKSVTIVCHDGYTEYR